MANKITPRSSDLMRKVGYDYSSGQIDTGVSRICKYGHFNMTDYKDLLPSTLEVLEELKGWGFKYLVKIKMRNGDIFHALFIRNN